MSDKIFFYKPENEIIKTNTLFRENVKETDKLLKYIINLIIILGSVGFLSVGISSYIKFNLIPFIKSNEIIFFPQGLVMSFYGCCGLILGINQMRILLLNIGEGFNEFNKEKGEMKIFRKGTQGKKSDINISYSLKDILRFNIL